MRLAHGLESHPDCVAGRPSLSSSVLAILQSCPKPGQQCACDMSALSLTDPWSGLRRAQAPVALLSDARSPKTSSEQYHLERAVRAGQRPWLELDRGVMAIERRPGPYPRCDQHRLFGTRISGEGSSHAYVCGGLLKNLPRLPQLPPDPFGYRLPAS